MAWRWPTPSTVITTPVRPDHVALDIAAPLGAPVVAPAPGRVERIWPMEPSGYGNLVILRTDSGQRVYLAHLSRFAPGLSGGQRIRAGQLVGYVGSTGRSTGNHLHLEVRDAANRPVDPASYFGQVRQLGQPNPGLQLPPAIRPTQGLSGAPIRLPGIALSPAARTQSATRPGGLTITTPVGPVSIPLPKIAWASLATIGAGFVVALISIAALVSQRGKSKLELAKEIAPGVAMAAGPEASGIVGALVAAENAKTGKSQGRAAGRGLKAVQKAQAKKLKAETKLAKAQTEQAKKPAEPEPEPPPLADLPNVPDYQARRERLKRIIEQRHKGAVGGSHAVQKTPKEKAPAITEPTARQRRLHQSFR